MARVRVLCAGLGAAILIAGAGCESADDFGPAQVTVSERLERRALLGLWTGTAEITGRNDLLGSVPGGARTGSGFAFPAALEFRAGGTFVLWTFNFAPAGDATLDRFCSGVFAVRSRTIEFFPNQICRALPLSQFRFVRNFPDALLLEAETRPGLQRVVDTDQASIRVRLSLRRD